MTLGLLLTLVAVGNNPVHAQIGLAVEDGTALASTFSGDSTTLIADRDLSVRGSNVVATKDTTLSAGRDLTLEAATQTHNETHYSKTKQSGVFGSGGIGFTIGSRQNSTDQKTDATLAAQSTVGSSSDRRMSAPPWSRMWLRVGKTA